MKPENKHSKSARQSLLKAVGAESAPNKDFLDKLRTLSTQEFETAANDAAPRSFESPWRHIMKNRITQVTSAAVILIAALVGIHFFVGGGVKVTFAEAVKPIMKAATLSYDFIVGTEQDGVAMHDIVTDSRIRRTMGDSIMVIDMDQKKMLILNDTKKEASYFDTTGPLGTGTQDFIKFIRYMLAKCQANPEFSPESLGEKEIDGRTVVGFKAGGPNEQISIWADARTAAPVQIEFGMSSQPYIIKNFQFDIPVDVSQVSMEVPSGYTLKETKLDLSNVTERDFIAGLKVWIEVLLDGRFPESITPKEYMQQMPQLETKVAALNLPEQEAEKLGTRFVKGMMFINLFRAHGQGQWHYAGQDAEYGDHETPVFWYQPVNSETWRVVYADLSVKDVAAEQLPK